MLDVNRYIYTTGTPNLDVSPYTTSSTINAHLCLIVIMSLVSHGLALGPSLQLIYSFFNIFTLGKQTQKIIFFVVGPLRGGGG